MNKQLNQKEIDETLLKESAIASKLLLDVIQIIPTSAWSVVVALLAAAVGLGKMTIERMPAEHKQVTAELFADYCQKGADKFTEIANELKG